MNVKSIRIPRLNNLDSKKMKGKNSLKLERRLVIDYLLHCLFSASLSCAAEIRALPAAFSLAEPMKYPGKQMPTASYTYGKDVNSFKDWDW